MCVVDGRIQINGQFRAVSLIKPENYAKLNLHSLKWAADRLEMDEGRSTEQKTWLV